MDEMTKKKISEGIATQADLIEMRKQIDLLYLTLEATEKSILMEEIKPIENPWKGEGEISEAIGCEFVQADIIRRKGMKEGACAALEYAMGLVDGIVKKKPK